MVMRPAGARCRASLLARPLARPLARAGLLGVLGGGLVVSGAGAALAKSDMVLSTPEKVVPAGSSVRLTGWAGDDAGIRHTVFCLQMRTPGRPWERTGHCVAPWRSGRWSAGFRFRTRPLARGRYAFRAVGVDPRHRHEVYGPSRAVHVTVR